MDDNNLKGNGQSWVTYQTQREGPDGCKDDVQSWVSGGVGSDQKQSAKGQVVLVVEREKPFNLGLEVVRGSERLTGHGSGDDGRWLHAAQASQSTAPQGEQS